MRVRTFLTTALALSVGSLVAQTPASPFKGKLELSVLDARGLVLDAATYRGRSAIHAVLAPGAQNDSMAVARGSSMLDGTVELDVAGQPAPGSSKSARGFIGIAFRVAEAPAAYECIYVRPTNARADDQLRRNRSTQYISAPDFPWQKLRADAPGVYESYVDLETGAWTHLKVAFAGSKARLYVNGALQPALVINDLKRPPAAGGVALWLGSEAEGWFSNLVLAPAKP